MRFRSLIGVTLLLLLAMFWAGTPANAQVVGGGLLLNGSFEGDYVTLGGSSETRVAPSWYPWWVGQRSDDAPWSNQRPQFGSTDTRLRSGAVSQRYYTDLSTHQAGLLQRVGGATRGDVLRFQVWATTWSSNRDYDCCSLESGIVELRAGIDPTGGTNPYASSVVWSDPIRSDDKWSQISVQATTRAETVTVFIFSAPKYPVRHNEVFLDDARLVVVGHEQIPSVDIPQPTALEDPLALSSPFRLENGVVNGPLVYSIQPGDTMGGIASQFDVDAADLADANGLAVDDTIYVGGQLIVPGLTFVAPDVVARYTMQEDDTLEEVAYAFNTTVYVLAQLNGIVNYGGVREGDEILVPIP